MHCISTFLDFESLVHYRTTLRFPNAAVALEALARAVAGNLTSNHITETKVVFRTQPNPAIAVLGSFDESCARHIFALFQKLDSIVARLRYIDYVKAEQDCARLAAHLTARFGYDEVRRFRYTAIPRGGFIVLGMLAYILGLDHKQLNPPHPLDVPLVIVDDCSLTGARFKDVLEHCESEQIIFSPLYAHPELRAAIEAQEPRVVACLSACDLTDHIGAMRNDEYDVRKRRWLAKFGERSYWVGRTEHLCFAWGEPDHVIYSADCEDLGNWQIVPPELCLKNRPGPDVNPIPVQIQLEGRGPLRPSERVIYGDFKQRIIVGDLKTGETFGLADVAADMWRHIRTYGALDKIVEVLLREYDVNETALRADLRLFVEDLLKRGLLEGAL